nr:helix-turn-helix transcriptional regulator [Microbacterium bovistercoris]
MPQTNSPETTSGDEIDVSGYVRRARRLADLSQRDLAQLVAVGQSTIARVESGGEIDVRTLARILAVANLRLAVVDRQGGEVRPMPADVLRDRAGRRRPAHLDVHARPDTPTVKMLLHSADPVPPGGSWHHLRKERDRIRAKSGRGPTDEQLSAGVVRARRLRKRR